MSIDVGTLHQDVARAKTVVAPSWPLSSTIAVNPLSGFEHRHFEDARRFASALFGARGHLTLCEYRDQMSAGRISFEDLRQALVRRFPDVTDDEQAVLLADLVDGDEEVTPDRWAITMVERVDAERGTDLRTQLDIEVADWCAQWAVQEGDDHLWVSWRSEQRDRFGELASDPAEALLLALDALEVPVTERSAYLERHVAALPGWAAHLRWRDEHRDDASMLEFLAVCLTIEAHLVKGTTVWQPTDGFRALGGPPDHRASVWQDAYEHGVHDELLRSISAGPPDAREPGRPFAQVVCCIDVRSEGLRRNLEAVGEYETYGYAGFFGLAAHAVPLSGGAGTDQFPVLLSASAELHETATPGAEREADHAVERSRMVAAADDAWSAAKYHPIAPLALAESAGWVAGPLAAIRTAAPRVAAVVADRIRRPAPRTTFDRSPIDPAIQAACVAGILRLGISARPARLVVVCGHHARVDNNPVESGLACGACGGNGGAPNARAVAAMANDPAVRAVLAGEGVPIPDDTWFVAAVHDTPTDTVELLDLHEIPESHRSLIAQLDVDLAIAGTASVIERARMLDPCTSTAHRSRPARLVRRVRARSRDWAEPVAELGLSGNMAFVVGPRSMTVGLDLGRRVFLHSYDSAVDADGSVLAGILTAPLVVAQWINAQYFFSTTDPMQFGAGTKAVHNVLGDVGLLSSGSGDLCRGLPLQSVRAGDQLLHEPVRLLAVVEGQRAHIDAAIAGSVTLRQLVENEWLWLVARSDPDSAWQQRVQRGWIERPLDLVAR